MSSTSESNPERRRGGEVEALLSQISELQRSRQDAGVLLTLAEATQDTRDLTVVYRAALEAIMGGLGVPRASILLFDADGVMRLTAWHGLSDSYRATVEGHTPWRADQPDPAPVIVPDVRVDPDLAAFDGAFATEGIGSLAFFPLAHDRRLLGKFMAYDNIPREFTPREIRLAAAIAMTVSKAVGRHRADERERSAHRRLALVAAITHTVTEAGLDLDRLVDTVVKSLSEALACKIELSLFADPPTAAAGDSAVPFGRIAVPLRVRGEAIGVVTALRARERAMFTDDDLLLLQEVGDRAAIGIANARLHHAVQHGIRAREQILSIVSHDLRSPLGGILTATDLLQRLNIDPPLGDRVRRSADSIRRLTTRMSRLISDLMDFVSIEAGHFAIEPTACSADDVVATTVESFLGQAAEREIDLQAHVKPGCPRFRADFDRIVQALTNIVSNAMSVSGRGGRVVLAVEPYATVIRFSVRDTGPGIRDEELDRIFERFWRSDRAAYKGTGLGLPIAKAIVEAHGGRIWAESDPGAGSTFLFELPAGI
jgi:signal transduction histidine kinase